MGAFIAGIKLTISQIVISIIMFIMQMVLVAVLASEEIRRQLDGIASDPSAVSALPVGILAGIVGVILLMIFIQGYVVNRMWGWS